MHIKAEKARFSRPRPCLPQSPSTGLSLFYRSALATNLDYFKRNAMRGTIGATKLYSLIKELAREGGTELGSESDNHSAILLGTEFEQAENWHSDRGEVHPASIGAVMRETELSYLVDLVTCKASAVASELFEGTSRATASVLESFSKDVSELEGLRAGQMILVVSCAEDRTKDSRHLQTRDLSCWSYLGDPSVTVLGLVPGETRFMADQLIMRGGAALNVAMSELDGIRGRYVERLAIHIKSSLMTAADSNSYSAGACYWGNMYAIGSVMAMIDAGVSTGVIADGFSLVLGGADGTNELEISLNGDVTQVRLGAKEHGFVRHVAQAIGLALSRTRVPLTEWSQATAALWALEAVRTGPNGLRVYNAMVYSSLLSQLSRVCRLAGDDVKHSRVLNECAMAEALDVVQEALVVRARKQEIVSWFGPREERVVAGIRVSDLDISEYEAPHHDNDCKGCASQLTWRRIGRLEKGGYMVAPGHGSAVHAGIGTIRVRIGLSRVSLRVIDGKLKSSVRFSPHDLAAPLTALREIEVMTGKLVWSERSGNDWHEVSNSMFNALLAGLAGGKACMWVLGLILYGDIKLKAGHDHACYATGYQPSAQSEYTANVPLGRQAIAIAHTYTDGTHLWVDFKDNCELMKIVPTLGRMCDLVVDRAEGKELYECAVWTSIRVFSAVRSGDTGSD